MSSLSDKHNFGGDGGGYGGKATTSPSTQPDKHHGGHPLSTPPPMENSEQKPPGTAYHDVHSSTETASPAPSPKSNNAPFPGTASKKLAPPLTMPTIAGVLGDTP
eukprot:CAMPEP_0178470402 /NCGR_PEP_ID=MMETSP0696-20121128/507_1 /TAXON_ID=265572 /ORGANISM="Extubocellulus spinifer, Strain CCMP396" /LENGTH=104 /DNA_ID=CAMNT_0020097501 /DNA_START=886 /DNA_END=1197 /DNA_ORIENTATION=+